MTTFIPAQRGPEITNGQVIDAEIVEEFTRSLDPPVIEAPPIPEQREAPPKPDKVKSGELKPILASWLKDREEFTGTVKSAGKRAANTTAYHVVYSPFHALRLLKYMPRGFWRVVVALWGWTLHGEIRPMQREHAINKQTDDWLKLERERKERISLRWKVLAVAFPLVLLTLVLAWFLLPSWTLTVLGLTWVVTPSWDFIMAGCLATAALGYIGLPADAPLFVSAVDSSGAPQLRPDLILNALCALGIPKMNNPDDIRQLSDLAREGSAGVSIELELPPGVPASSVLEKRSELSAALRHEIGRIWPGKGKRHDGHLILYVSDENMATAKQKRWPLLRDGTVDVFKPAPLFTDQRGRWVDLTLAYTNGVIGSVPRMGKTFALREIALVAGLDVRTRLYVYDLKGTGDLSALKLIAHCYGVGDEPEDIDQQLAEMRELRQEMRRRVKVIRGLPDEVCPDRKVTSELASERNLKLEPIVVTVDECQVWMEHEDPATQKEFITICTDLIKRGPAVGIMIYLATQKPDAKAIPTAIADNAIIRLCLMVQSWQSNDQVLGTGAHKRGLKATMFAFEDKGICYFKGEGPETQLVRTVAGLDAVEATKVATRARALREKANRLTGLAAGEDMDREVEEVILADDVRSVFDFGNHKTMHLGDIAKALAELRPGAYGSLDAESLGSQLRTAGVRTGSVHVPGKIRSKATNKGIRREWLDVDTTLEVGNSDPGEESFAD